MTHGRFCRNLVVLCALLVALVAGSMPAMAVVSTFTGAAGGQGLDLKGNFLYAVNTRGPGNLLIGDAWFTTDQGNATPGYTHNAGSEILNWSNPNFGSTTSDNNLEVVMQSIRHGAPGGVHQVTLDNLVVGRSYNVQLLFTESCCNRAFDVSVNGVLVADNFNIPAVQGGINGSPTKGVVISHAFTAASSTASIVLNGPGAAGPGIDSNPTLSGLTLEDTSGLGINVAAHKIATATSVYSATFAPGKAVNNIIDDAQGNQWLAADGVTSASLTIDLQGSFDVTEFQLLNTGNAGFLDRSTGTFSIDVATSNGIFSNVLGPRTLQSFAAGFQNEVVAQLKGIQFVRFNMLTIADPAGGIVGAAGGGLNEIRVIGVVSVPEPATAALGLMSLAGLMMRRRRNA